MWMGRNVSHTSSIDSLFYIHWSTNTFLINYSFISYYNIIIHCRYSFTPLLTQNNHHIHDCSSKYTSSGCIAPCCLWLHRYRCFVFVSCLDKILHHFFFFHHAIIIKSYGQSLILCCCHDLSKQIS